MVLALTPICEHLHTKHNKQHWPLHVKFARIQNMQFCLRISVQSLTKSYKEQNVNVKWSVYSFTYVYIIKCKSIPDNCSSPMYIKITKYKICSIACYRYIIYIMFYRHSSLTVIR